MNFWDFVNARAERGQKRWEIRQLAHAQRVAAGITWAQRYKGMTERQAVTAGLFALAVMMMLMAREDPKLWDIKLFEILVQGLFLTGLISMVLAFHFAANKGDEVRAVADAKRVDNTGKMADAVIAAATGMPPPPDPMPAADGPPVQDSPTGLPGDPLHVKQE